MKSSRARWTPPDWAPRPSPFHEWRADGRFQAGGEWVLVEPIDLQPQPEPTPERPPVAPSPTVEPTPTSIPTPEPSSPVEPSPTVTVEPEEVLVPGARAFWDGNDGTSEVEVIDIPDVWPTRHHILVEFLTLETLPRPTPVEPSPTVPVVQPEPVPVPLVVPTLVPAPVVVPVEEPDDIEEMATRPAWRVIRVTATAWSVIQLGIVGVGAYYFAGPYLGTALAVLIVGTSWALGLPGIARLAQDAGAGRAMLALHVLIALAILQSGFVAYFMHQAPHDDRTLLAREAHAALQSEVWAPAVAAVEEASGEVTGIEFRLAAECARQKCGTKAERIEAEKAVAMAKLATAEARRDALAPYFGHLPDEPAAIHANDVEAAAVAGRPTPARDAYVEPELLRPYYRLFAGDPFALLSLVLAALFDGVGIVLQVVQHVILHRRRH